MCAIDRITLIEWWEGSMLYIGSRYVNNRKKRSRHPRTHAVHPRKLAASRYWFRRRQTEIEFHEHQSPVVMMMDNQSFLTWCRVRLGWHSAGSPPKKRAIDDTRLPLDGTFSTRRKKCWRRRCNPPPKVNGSKTFFRRFWRVGSLRREVSDRKSRSVIYR